MAHNTDKHLAQSDTIVRETDNSANANARDVVEGAHYGVDDEHLVAIFGGQYRHPSGPKAIPWYDLSLAPEMWSRVRFTGSMTSTFSLSHGAQYRQSSGPKAIPLYLQYPDRAPKM